jgi:hypothetical protein
MLEGGRGIKVCVERFVQDLVKQTLRTLVVGAAAIAALAFGLSALVALLRAFVPSLPVWALLGATALGFALAGLWLAQRVAAAAALSVDEGERLALADTTEANSVFAAKTRVEGSQRVLIKQLGNFIDTVGIARVFTRKAVGASQRFSWVAVAAGAVSLFMVRKWLLLPRRRGDFRSFIVSVALPALFRWFLTR